MKEKRYKFLLFHRTSELIVFSETVMPLQLTVHVMKHLVKDNTWKKAGFARGRGDNSGARGGGEELKEKEEEWQEEEEDVVERCGATLMATR